MNNDNNTTNTNTDASDANTSDKKNTSGRLLADFLSVLENIMESDNTMESDKILPMQTKFRDLTQMGSYYIRENKVPLVYATGTIDAMLSILKNNANGDWRSSDALKAAAIFIKNDEKVSLADKTTLKLMVLEITRLGLTLSENQGPSKQVLQGFLELVPLAITRQYPGLTSICLDAVYRILDASTTNDVDTIMCFVAALVTDVFPNTTTKPSETYTGELATALQGITIRSFEFITPNIDWSEAITVNTDTGKVTKSHNFKHFLDVLEVLISRTPKERSLAMNFATNIIQKYRSERWITAFAELISDAIIDAHKVVDISDSSVVQFLRTKNQLIIDESN